MAYCNQCGHKNPDDNRFCEACGAPLQVVANSSQPIWKKRSAASSSQGWQPKPKEKRSGCWKKLLGLVVVGLAVWGISSWLGDSDDENVCEVSFDEADMVSDFQMDDIDWLIDFAVNSSLLEQEYIKVASNGFHDGEFLTGIGEYSDASEYFAVKHDMVAKYEKYKAAFERLAELDLFQTDDGLLSMAHWRGRQLLAKHGVYGNQMLLATSILAAAATSGATKNWFTNNLEKVWAWGTGATADHDQLLATLREMGAFSNKKIQNDIFNCLNKEAKGGYTDARSFFVGLNSGEMLSLGDKQLFEIRRELSFTEAYKDTYEKWVNAEKSLDCHQGCWDQWVDRGKELGDKAAKIEIFALDKITGGAVSNYQKVEKVLENAKKMKEMLFDGKTTNITIDDIEKAIKKRDIEKLRKHMPKTGSDAGDWMVKWICDKLQNIALMDDPNGSIAEKNKKAIIDMMNGTGDMSKALIVTNEDGSVSIVIPDDNGGGRIVAKSGKKRISAVQKDGKRTKTAKIKAKKGKNKIGRKKKKDDAAKKDGEDSDEPKDSHWKLVKTDAFASNGGEYFKGTKMTVSPGHFHMSGKCTEDFSPGAYSYYKHNNCKGEFLESTITYTEPKKYYKPGENVISKYSTSTSNSKYTCGVSFGPLTIGCSMGSRYPMPGYSWGNYFQTEKENAPTGAIRKPHEGSAVVEYTDVQGTLSNTMPTSGNVNDTLWIGFEAAHGRGEDIICVAYGYVWVEAKEKKEPEKTRTDEYSGNGIREREPEAIDGPVRLGIDPEKENITVPPMPKN